LKQEAVPGFDIGFEGFGAVSSRFLTRPMLIKPDLLSKEEEAYFLPHVFNIDESAAREDYRDYYGHKMVGPPARDYAPLQQAFDEALAAARILESMPDAPEQAWLRRLGIGMRMWVCEVRSINNFYFAQELRERNAAVLAGPVRKPPGTQTAGDPDSWSWHAMQRDEFDNTNQLIALLKGGGLEYLARAPDARHEDTFLLGPDVIDALQRKADLMREHWLDADKYVTPGPKP
jgi:hypothetical protein